MQDLTIDPSICDLFCDHPWVLLGPLRGTPVHFDRKQKAATGAAFAHYFDVPISLSRRLPSSALLTKIVAVNTDQMTLRLGSTASAIRFQTLY